MSDWAAANQGSARPVARFYRSVSRPGTVAQALFLVLIVALIASVTIVAQGNLDRLSVKSGYDFLWERAPFELGESLIDYSAGDTYFRAYLVGVLNTLKVAILGIVLSTVLGLFIALGQLSPSVVVARMCRLYIETARNVPLLMQLIFWYALMTGGLPRVKQALSPVEGVYLSNRGLVLPALELGGQGWVLFAALVLGLLLSAALLLWKRRSGVTGGALLLALALLCAPVLVTFLATGASVSLDVPELKGFNFRGGMTVSPEFLAVLLGLTLYTAAFNAEVIRGGIMGVPKGQTEAATALGLKRGKIMRLVVIPQALRIIIPPMSNNYLNLTKESSLAVAIGYPEVVRVATVTLAETSQSIECISIIMLVFLSISLTTSLLMNWYNARAEVKSR